jgi:predicted dehydrogenase
MIRRFGLWRTVRYNRERRRRERATGVKFDSAIHGRDLLRWLDRGEA